MVQFVHQMPYVQPHSSRSNPGYSASATLADTFIPPPLNSPRSPPISQTAIPWTPPTPIDSSIKPDISPGLETISEEIENTLFINDEEEEEEEEDIGVNNPPYTQEVYSPPVTPTAARRYYHEYNRNVRRRLF